MPKYLVAKEGLLKGLILNLKDKKEYVIGRDPDQADLVLEDASVSRKHALIYKVDDGYNIKDLSHTNPTIINNQEIPETHLLKEKDKIQIGQTTFIYTEKKPKKEKQKKEYAKLFEEPQDQEPQGEFETIFKEPKEEIEEENFQVLEKEPLQKKPSKEEVSTTPYDTIFEEEAEEEIPFNLLSENAIILKVISGPNAGAEFGMEVDKSYLLGKDTESCDIVFNDLSVSKEHAKITIDKEGLVYIEDLHSKNGVLVDSKKISHKQKISSRDLIVLGTTVFMVLNPQEAQETIYSPLPIREERDLEEKALEKEPLDEALLRKVEPWKNQIIPKKHLVMATSLALTLFIMVLSFFSLFKSEKVQIAQKEPIEEIKKALAKFDNVQFSFNPSGAKLFLVGHLLTAIEEQELLYNLDNITFIEDIENNIIIDEYLWKSTNNLLNDSPVWRGISIHSPKAGNFVVSGYVTTPEEFAALTDYLNANFPYTDKLQYNVVIENLLKLEIEGLILTKGLSTISYQLTNGEVILAGRYSEKETSSFYRLTEELKKTEGIRSIKNVAIKTSAHMAMVDLSSKYNISGYIASDNDDTISVIANNQIVNTGDFLDGMKVLEIKQNSIYLEKNGLKYKIDYIR